MQSARVWFLLALLPLLAGCFSLPVIYSEQPLGEPAVLDPKEWNGRWLDSNGGWRTFSVLGTDTLGFGPDGVCNPRLEDFEIARFRKSGRWYLYYKERDKTARTDSLCELTLLGRREGSMLQLFLINEERVKVLIEQGDLPGRIEGGRVLVGALTPAGHALLFSTPYNSLEERKRKYPITAENDLPYDSDEPLSFVKLPDELDPCKKAGADK